VRIENKKAFFDYEVVEKVEAGIVLLGSEVKSIKQGQINLTGSRIVPIKGELWVVGMTIPKYRFTTDENYELGRSRKILIKKKERLAVEAKRQTAGLTLVPLAVYNKGSLIKLEIGLVRGKKKYEKRDILKKRSEERQIERVLKNKRPDA